MAGRVKARAAAELDLPAPLINDSNRAALEASGARQGGRGGLFGAGFRAGG